MNKIVLGLFLIGFWLFLPIGMIAMNVTGYDSIENNPKLEQRTGLFGIIDMLLDGVKIYFNMLVFNIPNVHEYIIYIVRFLQFASFVFLLILFGEK